MWFRKRSTATLRLSLHNDSIKIQISFQLFLLIMSTNLNALRNNFTNSITRYIFTFHLHLKDKMLIMMVIMKNKIKGVFIWEKSYINIIHPTTNTLAMNAILQNNSQLRKKLIYRVSLEFSLCSKSESSTYTNA